MKANQVKIGTRAVIARESEWYSLAKDKIGEKATVHMIVPRVLEEFKSPWVKIAFDSGYGNNVTSDPAPWYIDLDCLDELPEGE